MCGFVAIYHKDEDYSFSKSRLKKMGNAILSRGPDEQGLFIRPNVALAHNRLSIVDIDGGKQPMHSACGAFSLVFNGEIYNHRDIRYELEKEGVTFLTSSDTEVVLQGYINWGVHIVEKLNGMFSFAIWDGKNKELFVARDRYGIKPLFHMVHESGEHIFASDLPAIEASVDQLLPLDLCTIDSYLTLGYASGGKTFYENVSEVLPGHCYQVTGTRTKVFQYWDVESAMSRPHRNLSSVDGIELLEQSVGRQSMGEVPVGSFLSGGLDSSLLCHVYVNANPDVEFKTYSAGFDKEQFDELDDAKRIAALLGAENNQMRFRFNQVRGQSLLLDAFSTPFSDNAALPMVHLSALAKKDITVAFSGDGADELFFGYRNHKLLMIERLLARFCPQFSMRALSTLTKGVGPLSKLSRVADVVSQNLPDAYVSAMSLCSRETRDSLYSMSMKNAVSNNRTEDYIKGLVDQSSLTNPLKIIQMLDFKTYLPGSVLAKVDRSTMFSGIEARVPYLDNDIVDAVLPQPPSTNLSLFNNKKQLRRWGGKVMGSQHSKQKKKSFTSPLDTWFRKLSFDEIYRSIASEAFLDSRLFNVDTVRFLIEDHHSRKSNNGNILWSLSVLTSFLDRRDASQGIRIL